MTLLCLYTVLVFAVLTSATPLWVNINAETGVSLNDLNNAYATSSGTLAVGCIFFVPLALRYGRRPVYIITSLIMTASAIWQARSYTTGDFIGSNVLSGLAGAVNEALFQVTVLDLYFVHQRATANGIYLMSVCIGNYLGPVAAGYVAVSQGWRWVFYYLAIFQGVTSLALIVGLEESKYDVPKISGRAIQVTDSEKTAPVTDSKEEPDLGLVSAKTRDSVLRHSTIPVDSYWRRHRLITLPSDDSESATSLLRHIIQPFILLVQFPAIAFAALQYGWLVSMLSVVAVTQATIYPAPPYNFSPASVGLMSLPPAIGAILGSLFGGPLVDVLSVQVAKRRSGIHEPETRLWLFMVPGCGMIVGVLMYGLTIAKVCPMISWNRLRN
jgi:MFS family permease